MICGMGRLGVVISVVWVMVGFALLAATTDDGSPEGKPVTGEVDKSPYHPPDYYAVFEVAGKQYRVLLPEGQEYRLFESIALRYPDEDPALARPAAPTRVLDPWQIAGAAAVAVTGVAAVVFFARRPPGPGLPPTVTATLLIGSIAAIVGAAVFFEDPGGDPMVPVVRVVFIVAMALSALVSAGLLVFFRHARKVDGD